MTAQTTDLGRCTQNQSNTRWPHRCSRDAKEIVGGEAMCAQHAAGARRRKANEDAHRLEEQNKRSAEDRTKARLCALTDKLGIQIGMQYVPSRGSGLGRYSETRATVSIDDLEALAERLGS